MRVVVQGLVHLLDRDGSSLCSCPFGLLTGSLARCTCPSCAAIWKQARHERFGRPPVVDDLDNVGH